MAGGPNPYSLYPKPAENNLLGQFGSAVGVMNALTQGEIGRQQLDSEKAVGELLKGSLMPGGGIDQTKFAAGLAKLPSSAAFKLPGVLNTTTQNDLLRAQHQNQLLQGKGLEIQNQRAGADLGASYQKQVQEAVGSLTALGDKITPGHVVGSLTRLYLGKAIDEPTYRRYRDEVTQIGKEPAKLQRYVFERGMQALGTEAMFRPTQTGVGSRGEPMMGTLPQFAREALNIPGLSIDAGSAAAPGGTARVGAGTPGPGKVAAATAAPPNGPARRPGIAMGLAPGEAEAQAKDMARQTDVADALRTTAEKVPERKALFDNMLADLKDIETGPTSYFSKNANALASRFLGTGVTMSADQIAKMESFDKLAKQIAMQQAGAMGSDSRLSTAMGGNPNLDLSKVGNKQIIHMLKGNEDAIAAKNQAWQAFKAANGASSYDRFSTDFNKTFDPRVFQAMHMDPKERASMFKTLSEADKKRFVEALAEADRQGWVKRPGQ